MAFSKETKEIMELDYKKIEEKKQRKLTLKQRKFIKYYLESGDGAESVRRAYNVRNQANAISMAKRLIKELDFELLLEVAGVSDSQLAVKMKEGLNATKVTRTGQVVADLEVRYKYLVTALESKHKIKNKLEVTGENGQPIRFNILAGHGFIPPSQSISQPAGTNASSETDTTRGPTKVQDSSMAQTGKKDDNSNH